MLHRHFLELLLGLNRVPGPIRGYNGCFQDGLLRWYACGVYLHRVYMVMHTVLSPLLGSSIETPAIPKTQVLVPAEPHICTTTPCHLRVLLYCAHQCDFCGRCSQVQVNGYGQRVTRTVLQDHSLPRQCGTIACPALAWSQAHLGLHILCGPGYIPPKMVVIFGGGMDFPCRVLGEMCGIQGVT